MTVELRLHRAIGTLDRSECAFDAGGCDWSLERRPERRTRPVALRNRAAVRGKPVQREALGVREHHGPADLARPDRVPRGCGRHRVTGMSLACRAARSARTA